MVGVQSKLIGTPVQVHEQFELAQADTRYTFPTATFLGAVVGWVASQPGPFCVAAARPGLSISRVPAPLCKESI